MMALTSRFRARRPVPYLLNSQPGPLQSAVLGFAHRGADLDYENTLAALQRASAAGFRYLEIDVRTSADGELVVFHDATLNRITNGFGLLSQHTWDDLATVRVLPRHLRSVTGVRQVTPAQARDYGEPLLRFEDALTQLPDAYFNVDLKDSASVPVFVDTVRRHGATDRVLAASFQDRRRRAVQRALPDIATSPGVLSTAVFTAAAALPGPTALKLRTSRLAALQVPVRSRQIPVVTPGFVAQAHAVGLQVHVWVVDDPAEAHRLIDLGVDGLITDDAAALSQVLKERSIWPQI